MSDNRSTFDPDRDLSIDGMMLFWVPMRKCSHIPETTNKQNAVYNNAEASLPIETKERN